VAVSPDGGSVYVASERDDSVFQYDVGAGGALAPKSPATVATGASPEGIAVSPAAQVPASKDQCKHGGWRQFGFKSQGRCVAFVVLTRICHVLERHGHHHLKFCPPMPPRRN
jgi:hypothetical protein